MSRLSLVAFLASVLTVTCASLPPVPVRGIEATTYPHDPLLFVATSPDVAESVRVIADRSWQGHTEVAGCLTWYTVMIRDSVRVVWLQRIVPSRNVLRADSVAVWPKDSTDFCAKGQPDYHTHIELDGFDLYTPSDTDRASLARDGQPFDVLISVPKDGPIRVTIFTAAPRG